MVKRALLALALGALALVTVTLLQVSVVGLVTPPLTPRMVHRWVETGERPEQRVVALEGLGESGPRAVVASEDARFFLHRGFDLRAICRAVKDARGGQRLRGASTITQQVSKNLFLPQGRSWSRKLAEAWYTWWMERLLSKRRILELYLNIAETGPGQFGLEAGAWHHFGKPAAALNAEEAARLASVLPNPTARSVHSSRADRHVDWVAVHPAPYVGERGRHATEAATATRRSALATRLRARRPSAAEFSLVRCLAE